METKWVKTKKQNETKHLCSFQQWIGSIDLFPNEDAHANIIVDPAAAWTAQEQAISQKVEETLAGEKVDAILCVAGGWAGGNAASKGQWSRLLLMKLE